MRNDDDDEYYGEEEESTALRGKLRFKREVNVSAYLEGLKRRITLGATERGKKSIDEAFDKQTSLRKLVLAYEYQASSRDAQIARDNE